MIPLRPSRILLLLLGSSTTLAILAVWIAHLPLWFALFSSVGLLLHLAWQLRYWQRLPWTHLQWDVSNGLQWRSPQGVWHTGEIIRPIFVHPLGIAGRVRIAEKVQPFLILPDALPRQAHRQLRVWLRWHSALTENGG